MAGLKKPEGFRFHHISTDEVYGALGAEGLFHYAGAPAVSWADIAEATFAEDARANSQPHPNQPIPNTGTTPGQLSAGLHQDRPKLRN